PVHSSRRASLSINEMKVFVDKVASLLLSRAGLCRFDRVAVWKTNGPDYYFFSSAIIRAGGVSVPINPGMEKDSLKYYLKHTGARILVTDEETMRRHGVNASDLDMIDHFVVPSVSGDFEGSHTNLQRHLPDASPLTTPVKLHGDADVLLVHTSGTTGFPKATIVTSRSLIGAIRSDAKRHFMSPSNRVLTGAPFNHAFSHILMMVCLMAGIRLWSLSEPDGEKALKTIEENKLNVVAGFAIMFLRMYLTGLDRFDLRSVRAWMSVADAAHEVHMRAFVKQGAFLRLGPIKLISSMFLDGLGSSEVGTSGTRFYVNSFTRTFNRCIGSQEWFGPRVKCGDEYGRRLPPGQLGRMYTKGETLFKGYWNAHERLHGTVIDGWWWTGDVVYQDWWGRYFHLDRAADTIHTKEGPVYTLVIEESAVKHPDVLEAACFAVPGPEGAEEVALVAYVLKEGASSDVNSILAWTNDRITIGTKAYGAIRVGLEDLPLGLTGKVLKRKLREIYVDYYRQDKRAIAPESAAPVAAVG
ncbi:MAG: class I adenylate-forming enzyme family protein, partial [Myxococcota bacterium]